jgi:hypothetical protein
MKRALVLTLPMLILGCGDESPAVKPSLYASPTAPESLIANLQTSYRNREIKGYAKLFAPGFIFRFQPIDTTMVGTQFWTREEDANGTRALFSTSEVAEIRINLTYLQRDSTIDISPPVDSLRIRIVATDLQVDQTDGTTWEVSGQQDMFFRKGLAALGEDPKYWWMYAWNDVPFISSAGPPRGTEPAVGHGTTWGRLKAKYHL